MKKLDQPHGLDLKFPVVLSGPHQTISCYFSCEEIVGTQIIKTLEPDIPSSAFIDGGAQPGHREPPKVDLLDSDFDLDDVDDVDMLEALDSADTGGRWAHADMEHRVSDTSGDGEFRSVEDILIQESSLEMAPQKMDNGKWMCQHHCRNGGPTKSGKPCSHRCCREGVDKPRLLPARKKANATVGDDGVEDNPQPLRDCSSKQTESRRSDMSSSVSERNSSLGRSNELTLRKKHPLDKPMIEDSPRKRPALSQKPRLLDIPVDIDCIDLSIEGGDAGAVGSTDLILGSTMRAENGKEKREGLYGYLQRDDAKSAPLNKALVRDTAQIPTQTPPPTNRVSDNLKHEQVELSDDEFPEIDELLRIKTFCAVSSSPSLPEMAKGDETLYPGVVQTLKDSMDNGLELNLSFTTVDELRKASNRLGLPNISSESLGSKSYAGKPCLEPSTPVSEMPSVVRSGATRLYGNAAVNVSDESALVTVDDDQPLFFNSDPVEPNPGNEHLTSTHTQRGRPSWMSEYNPEDIDVFRGDFHFVD